MGETVVGSTSSASNMHEAANDNTNPYRKYSYGCNENESR